MTPVVRSAYTGLLAENMFLKDQLKVRMDAEAAEEAKKKPRAGMTIAHLGMHQFSTPAVLQEAIRRAAITKGAKDKGKGKAAISPSWMIPSHLGSPMTVSRLCIHKIDEVMTTYDHI